MHSSANALCKLYLSVIDDVIENVRETFLDEGVEEGVLNELRQLWVSKVMQSKAVEGFRKDTINPSNFVLQLPANYTQTLQKQSASIILPPGQNVQNYTAKAGGAGAVATFSLPPGVTYPVHIPAGVTLQTASGHFYKVNVPVVVTQAPRSNRVFTQPAAQRAPPRPPPPQPAPSQARPTIQQAPAQTSNSEPTPAASSSTASGPQPDGSVAQADQPPPKEPPAPVDETPQAPVPQSVPPPPPVTPQPVPESPGDFTLEGIDFSPHPEGTLKQEQGQLPACEVGEGASNSNSLDTPEKEVKEEAPDGLPVSDGTAFFSLGSQLDEAIKMELLRDFNYSGLEDIVQLDGAGDGSSEEEEVDIGGPVGENDFLGMISAEALHVLEEAGGSDDSSSTSSSDMEKEEVIEELDPLNSGDDVSEQDIPDLFDTENVIVCQYEKIHRSKNRWKFNLRDGVMCYGGKDYVFSRAIGEAEW
ncbi:TFIIA-alpha and beta-like factor [Sardina pilchardus]|uniref:TFIIA-alpha and beta-like factor n=1 Tax=Sardina pilchardus TaxID=27697 RepID=UPI002E116523